MSKICSKCKMELSLNNFHKSKNSKSGYQSYCKSCTSTKNRQYLSEYRKENKDKIKSLNNEWYLENREVQLEKFREYYKSNREYIRQRGRIHYENNKSLYLHYSKLRKLYLKRAVPNWLTEDHDLQIKKIYKQCSELSKLTNIEHHVDHIVPLCGEYVCGLHVPWNLQIITAEENLRKSNKHESDDFSPSVP